MAGEKTEKATPKRKQDERKKGNTFQSQEIIIVFSLLSTFYGFKLLVPMTLKFLEQSIRHFFDLGATVQGIGATEVRLYFIDGLITFGIAAIPMLLISSLVAVILTIAQTRGLVSFESIKPKGNRLSPINGFKKMFSVRGIVELMKSLIKITVLIYILYDALKDEIGLLPRLMDMTPLQVMAQTGGVILSIVKTCAIIFAFLAGFDYLYQWWEYEKNLRMSKQEIKEEYKQTEGDPQIKGRLRERQQQASRRRMMQNVPNADVVIRNPTHVAVAIRYDPEKDIAPVVLAKGVDSIALKIVEIAQAHGIVTTENVALARGLYEAVELDQEIPGQFYQPVAEVLAFVYNIKENKLK